jgi:zinc D-Ala-D-Ala dipeptidase
MNRRMLACLVCAMVVACTRQASQSAEDTSVAAAPSSPAAAPAPLVPSAPPIEPFIDAGERIHDLVVDMRYRDAGNFTGARLPGYEANRCWLMGEVVEALGRAAAEARKTDRRLLVWDCWRPVVATKAMVEWTSRVNRSDLLGVYIGATSMHNAGVAIDLTMATADGTPIDMGTPFDEFSRRAHTDNAAGQILANRLALRDAMIAAGFTPYRNEWWHFFIPVPGRRPVDGVIR